MIRRLLIANRGEIAVRIIRAAQELGISTIAVYGEPDAGALHTRLADERIYLDGSLPKDTYLHQKKLVAAAIQCGADAVHPGYGFLAENADFARLIVSEGLVFVGPSADAITVMGDKHLARVAAANAGVPVLPGTASGATFEVQRAFAEGSGFPVMIKAVAGGSGRGMRVAQSADELEEKIGQAMREAEKAFSNPAVYLERFLAKPRHIEVQVFGDSHGNVIHLGERECSVQRRHQKIIEEAPAVGLKPAIREQMLSSAVSLARSVRYQGAGTIEYLVEGPCGEETGFYFLEMNTRIQVEHPVTEMVTGLDLVKEQLLVASGERLSLSQDAVCIRGHAIEFRINAENPQQQFTPVTGRVKYISRHGGPGVREDGWVESGTKISPYYDALLAKVIIYGNNRQEALKRARSVLSNYLVEGMPTTLEFHRWLLTQDAYARGEVDVFWIEREYQGQTLAARTPGPFALPKMEQSNE